MPEYPVKVKHVLTSLAPRGVDGGVIGLRAVVPTLDGPRELSFFLPTADFEAQRTAERAPVAPTPIGFRPDPVLERAIIAAEVNGEDVPALTCPNPEHGRIFHGVSLYWFRRRARVSRVDLARSINRGIASGPRVDAREVRAVERDTYGPRLEHVEMIARALKVEERQLFRCTGPCWERSRAGATPETAFASNEGGRRTRTPASK